MEEASLAAAVEALRGAGFEPEVTEAPRNWAMGESGAAAWIPVKGADTYIFVVVRGLSFDQSASPLVLPRARWERDVDYDLVRHGLLTRDQIPMPS